MSKRILILAVIVSAALAGLLLTATPTRDASAGASVYLLQGEPGVSACGTDPCTAQDACVLQGDQGSMGACTCP